MPSTPPPTSLRAHTPPTPLHGPRADNYEPYSPRRSKRSTAHNNPYSSYNSERSPKGHLQRDTTPPPTVKKARFARAHTQLSSPPSSPNAVTKHSSPQQLRKTPRKQLFSSRKPLAADATSDSDGAPSSSGAMTSRISANMLPTPSKTPQKRQTAALHQTARILHFQPNHPNDAMPTRKMKKRARNPQATSGFELYDDETPRPSGGIEIYTDANARVPEVDESEDNPFVGEQKASARPQRRKKTLTADQLEQNESIAEAERNDQGVTYVFRGKKVFRPFATNDDDATSSIAASDLGATHEQRALRRQAGASAQRPLTRSTIKPRLLFPTEQQLRERQHEDDIDEEATTDIEAPNAPFQARNESNDEVMTGTQEEAVEAATPIAPRIKHRPATPPTTVRSTRSWGKKKAEDHVTPSVDTDNDAPAHVDGAADDPLSNSSVSHLKALRKPRSPFDAWQRTKSGKKRGAETDADADEGLVGVKRTRAGAPGLERGV